MVKQKLKAALYINNCMQNLSLVEMAKKWQKLNTASKQNLAESSCMFLITYSSGGAGRGGCCPHFFPGSEHYFADIHIKRILFYNSSVGEPSVDCDNFIALCTH